MFQICVDSAVNCLSSHHRWNDDPPLVAIFPFGHTNFVQVKHKFSPRSVNMVSESIDRRFKKNSRHFKPRIFLQNTFGFKKLVCMAGYKRVDSFSRNAFPESLCALMQKFRPVHRPVICCFVREPLNQFLFTSAESSR
jgi:hypothetical protein